MRKKKIDYSHTLVCFDIETSKDVIDRKNAVWCWSWQLIYGEAESDEHDTYVTADSWEEFWNVLFDIYEKSKSERIIVYVHNLAHELEFLMRNSCSHDMTDYFAKDSHAPLYAVFDNAIEFRCSYFLTNKSLAQCGKDVGMLKAGDFDYSKVRYPGEVCTEKENHYREWDVRIMMAKIRQLQRQEGMNFWEFPLTNTAFLRNELRAEMSKDKRNKIWFNKMRMSYDEYIMCRDAFAGGYTHSNYFYTGDVVYDVDSFDFGSAYPFAMLVYKYPSSRFHRLHCKLDTLRKMIRNNVLFVAKLAFTKIKSVGSNTYLSYSKCKTSSDVIVDNGRIYMAGYVETTMTSLDLEIVLEAYRAEEIKVLDCYWCQSDYLPDAICKLMLKYYAQKQKLKDNEEELENYMKAKNRVNAFYGMCVQNPLNDETMIDDILEWKRTKLDYTDKEMITELLNKYYKNWASFLPYQVGIFVPAYTRRNLWHFILNAQDKVVYCDTDSCKYVDLDEDVLSMIDNYNTWARNAVSERLAALDVEEKFDDLGVFDHETSDAKGGKYVKFKTLGAKKYLYEKADGTKVLTVSGLSKEAVKYINDFDDFSPGVTFDEEVSGRTVSKCFTNEVNAPDAGGMAIYNTTYSLNVSDLYSSFLGGIEEKNWLIGKNGRYYDDEKKLKARKTISIDIDQIYRKNTWIDARKVVKL